jgi:hypothetical protein
MNDMRVPRILAVAGIAAALGVAALDGAPAHAEGSSQTVRATVIGKDISHTVDLKPGLMIVRGRHSGPANFWLDLTPPYPGVSIMDDYDDHIPVFNEIGVFNGAAAVRVERADTCVLDLVASGSFERTSVQPDPATTVGVNERQFSGRGT